MAETFLILLTAHLIGDFILQPGWMVRRKQQPGVLLLHVLLVTAVTAALLGGGSAVILGAVFASHLVMDAIKVWLMSPRSLPASAAASPPRSAWTPLGAFTIDQLVHLSVIIALALFQPDAAARGIWMRLLPAAAIEPWLTSLTLIAAAIICVPVGGIIIGMLTAPLLEEIRQARRAANPPVSPALDDEETEGLRNGGRTIGWLERALVLLLVLIDMPTGVGFLIAAKSILRYGDIKDTHQRRLTEYVIIGTFLSFGWGLLVAAVTVRAIGWWG